MCLTSTTRNPFIADEDLIVYKVLIERYLTTYDGNNYKTSLIHPRYVSPFLGYYYEFNRLYKTVLMPMALPFNNNFIIEEGFHYYLDLEQLEFIKSKYPMGHILIKCIVPQGSEYFLENQSFGGLKVGVSNQIIITDKIIYNHSNWEGHRNAFLI